MSEPSEPKITGPSGDKIRLREVELSFMREIEARNAERAKRLLVQRRNSKITAFGLGAAVIGIYLYSMHAVKQETFLDNFDRPEKIVK